jgi:hypothetical protein
MAIQTLYPNIEPSLNLSFALTKTLDPRITFVRTTTGVFYDGKTTAKAEENLLLHSQEFTVANGWSATRASVTTNTTTAPDGTSTADSLIEDNTASNTHRTFVSVTSMVTVGRPHVVSVFAKKDTRDQIFIRKVGGTGFDADGCLFDLTLGTVSNVGTGATGSIVNVGNGWYRCIVVCENAAGQTNDINIALAVSGNITYSGDNVSGLFLWGAQLEQRSAVTAYTPTTTQPITNYIPVLLTAASGVARFDHNPTTGESLGLLVEEQRTNLCLQSEDFSTTWTNSNSVEQTNTVVAPDGTLTADLLQADSVTTSSGREFRQNVNGTVTAVHTFSVYAKARNGNFLGMNFRNQAAALNFCTAEFNLSTGAISVAAANGGNATGATASITNVGNGWYRCSVSGIVDTSGTQFSLLLTGRTTSNNNNVAADTELCYLWGAQLEAGAFPTSYIPTVAATVTRNSDAASMTGTNFSSWFNNAEGTLYAEALSQRPVTDTTRVIAISDGTASNSIRINAVATSVAIVTNNTSEAVFTQSYTANAFNKFVIGYKRNDAANSSNAATASTDTSVILPVVNQLEIGRLAGGASGSILVGTIRKLAFYPSRLTNVQLQALTS